MIPKIGALALCLGGMSFATYAAPETLAPRLESALVAPTNVEISHATSPEAFLRLKDPQRGGVLSTSEKGSALLVGPADGGSFVAAAAVEFLEPDTSVELRVIDGRGHQIDAVVISSPVAGHWNANLCVVQGGRNGRIEMAVMTGKALGTAYRISGSDITTIPILSRTTVHAAGGGTAAFTSSKPKRRTTLTLPASGSSSYSRSYDWPGTSFTFSVSGAPANTCGEIHTLRNGSWVVTSNWICTDGTGYGRKGPWYITTTFPGMDQRDDPTYILWPDGTQTTNTWHDIDVTSPTLTPQSSCTFCGTAADAQWGSGFNRSWTTVLLWFHDDTSGLWWDQRSCTPTPDCYWTGSPHYYTAQTDLPTTTTTFQLTWWYYPYLWCPQSHQCSAYIKVNDIWSSRTVNRVFSQ